MGNTQKDNKVNINFMLEVYLLSNFSFGQNNDINITKRQMISSYEKLYVEESIRFTGQPHCDAFFHLKWLNYQLKKPIDVKLYLDTNKLSKSVMCPVLVDQERNSFSGIKNAPMSIETYYSKKKEDLKVLANVFSQNEAITLNITEALFILENKTLTIFEKQNALQILEHKLFMQINLLYPNIRPIYSPHLLFMMDGKFNPKNLEYKTTEKPKLNDLLPKNLDDNLVKECGLLAWDTKNIKPNAIEIIDDSSLI
jgi:hypothetical protein